MEGVREIRMTLDELSDILEEADLIDGGETIESVLVLNTELIITVVQ
jgi:hypothetical protein